MIAYPQSIADSPALATIEQVGLLITLKWFDQQPQLAIGYDPSRQILTRRRQLRVSELR